MPRGRRRGLGGLSWAHPGASPSIGPWGMPSAAPSRLPRTNARFDDLVGHPRRRRSCGEARSRHGGPSASQPFYSYSPKFIFESTAKGPTRPGAYRRVHSAALAPARRLLPGRSSPFAPSLAPRWQREPPWAIFISPSKRRQLDLELDLSDPLFENWIVSTLCLTTTNQPN